MYKTNLLIVEDDPNLGQILKEYLHIKGFEADLFTDGRQGMEAFHKKRYDICLLDVMLPKKDGFSLAKDIRSVDKRIPIIFLTAKSLNEDTLEGFRIGADDYITKPFSMEELLLRIKAVWRRCSYQEVNKPPINKYEFGQFQFDFDNQALNCKSFKKKLTTKEAELLKILCQNLNKTVDRKVALKQIWKDDNYFNARSMDVYIAKLRKYLKADRNIQILTVHGQGFKLVNIQ